MKSFHRMRPGSGKGPPLLPAEGEREEGRRKAERSSPRENQTAGSRRLLFAGAVIRDVRRFDIWQRRPAARIPTWASPTNSIKNTGVCQWLDNDDPSFIRDQSVPRTADDVLTNNGPGVFLYFLRRGGCGGWDGGRLQFEMRTAQYSRVIVDATLTRQ